MESALQSPYRITDQPGAVTLLARLEGDGGRRVARSAQAGYLIAGAARLHIYDEIDSLVREKKSEAWRDSVEAQLRGGVRDINKSRDLEIQAVRVYGRGIGNGVNGSGHD